MSRRGQAMAGRDAATHLFVLWAAEPGDDFERIESYDDLVAARAAARVLAAGGRYEFFQVVRGRKRVWSSTAGQEAA